MDEQGRTPWADSVDDPPETEEGGRAFQASVVAEVLGVVGWRLEEMLASDNETSRALDRTLRERLAFPELAPAKAALRRLVILLNPHVAPAQAVADATATSDDMELVRLVIERSRRMLTAEPLEPGAWAVLRLLAGKRRRRESIAFIARLYGMPIDLVLGVLQRLEAKACVALEPAAFGLEARLTDHGVDKMKSDPIPALVHLLKDSFDEDELWNLMHLGAALVRADSAWPGRVNDGGAAMGAVLR